MSYCTVLFISAAEPLWITVFPCACRKVRILCKLVYPEAPSRPQPRCGILFFQPLARSLRGGAEEVSLTYSTLPKKSLQVFLSVRMEDGYRIFPWY